MHEWICPIHRIHLIGRKFLHFEKTRMSTFSLIGSKEMILITSFEWYKNMQPKDKTEFASTKIWIWIFDKVIQHQKILLKIASVITSSDELNTLGIWLGCEPNDVRRLTNSNPNLKDAAHEILCSFYNSVPNAERWTKIIEALEEMNKRGTVKELGLEELHREAWSHIEPW